MESRCQFWLPKKNRFCANAPLSPSPFVLRENLDAHVKKCPLLKQVQALQTQPFFKKGVNGGKDEDSMLYDDAAVINSKEVEDPVSSMSSSNSEHSNISSEMKRDAIYKMRISEFFELLQRIKSIHNSLVQIIKESYAIPEACGKWLKKQLDWKLPFQEKHVLQQASILGNLENFGILKRSVRVDDPMLEDSYNIDEQSEDKNGTLAVVEFGAGRGYLTQMLADCYGIQKVYLVERRSYKFKADRSLRQKEKLSLERLRIDIEDLDLDAIESLRGASYLAIGKHLCGPAADKKFLADMGITKEDFHAITWFTSWAVDDNHGSDIADVVNRGLHLHNIQNGNCDGRVGGVAEIVRNMKAVDRAMLGLMCKEIIDIGRLMWVKEHHGLAARLVKYVPADVSPENHLLVARG